MEAVKTSNLARPGKPLKWETKAKGQGILVSHGPLEVAHPMT